ncbi:hypothetical protein FOZ60_000746 [Perkinsus olseni]|uniref:Uncharacterized protein n=1 Tax=Perkinsus olseni TaxID=32597 RepID=A0A7J6P1F7_PEROL|nr:hypothetical protein FOZ60_000746 [Perkinsus olseni]
MGGLLLPGRDDELNIREFHGPVPLVVVPESSEETDNKAAADKPKSSSKKASKGRNGVLLVRPKACTLDLWKASMNLEILQRENPTRRQTAERPASPLNRTVEGAAGASEMGATYEKPELSIDEDTLAAFEDLAEVPGDRLGLLTTFFLCYRDWQWELVLALRRHEWCPFKGRSARGEQRGR